VQPPHLPVPGSDGQSNDGQGPEARSRAVGRSLVGPNGKQSTSVAAAAGGRRRGRDTAGGRGRGRGRNEALKSVLAKSEAASARAGAHAQRRTQAGGARSKRNMGESNASGDAAADDAAVSEEERKAARSRLYGDMRGVWATREAQRRRKEAAELRAARGSNLEGHRSPSSRTSTIGGARGKRSVRSASSSRHSQGRGTTRGGRGRGSEGVPSSLAMVERPDPERTQAQAASRLYGEAERRRRKR